MIRDKILAQLASLPSLRPSQLGPRLSQPALIVNNIRSERQMDRWRDRWKISPFTQDHTLSPIMGAKLLPSKKKKKENITNKS